MPTANTTPSTPAPADRQQPAPGMLASRPWSGLMSFVAELDAALHELSEASLKAADESTLAVYLGLKELDDRWTKAEKGLLAQVAKLHGLEQKARALSDTAKVRAHLGKADILDAAQEVREKLQIVQRRLHSIKVKGEGDVSQVLKSLASSCNELARRLDDGPAAVDTKDGGQADDDEWM
jgi:hypothetical protein